jgi:saccharopine dehydrogenase (NADP+, L-glutamate forming)
MKKILVLGAGLSSSYLIKYLSKLAAEENWMVSVADADQHQAILKAGNHPQLKAIRLNVSDAFELDQLIAEHDVAISLIPPAMHIIVAKACLKHKKHLITASYISPEMHNLHVDALKAGVLFLNECGLDPGIDHLSAMQAIHRLQGAGAKITSFKSYCGGLVAPEFDTNPWHYKFTWNPRNIVLAGQATAKYLENNELKFIPQGRIFTQTEPVLMKNEAFESYANRDSLGYIKPYGIEGAHTVLRGTLRRKGYSHAWNMLIKLGLTDDTFIMTDASTLTYRMFTSAFTPGTGMAQLEERIANFLGIQTTDEAFKQLHWLGLFDEEQIKLNEGTPAQILQLLLQHKWKLGKGELDMIVMQHNIEYTINKKEYRLVCNLMVKGEDETYTAMAKTVGLPLGIAAKQLLQGKIKLTGVQMPLHAEIYEPILDELKTYGVAFEESTEQLH